MEQLKAYEYIPQGPAYAAVFLLHGYGANGADLFSLKELIAQTLGNDVAVISFEAPFACEMGMGEDYRQWFSLQDYSMAAMEKGAALAHQYLLNTVNSYLEKLNLSPQNIILAGFSQGCMMSLYTALRMEKPVAAVIGWSGLLIDNGNLKDEITAKPSVQLWHGDSDTVVPPFCLKEAKEKLQALDISVEAHMVPNCEHTIAPQALTASLAFMKKHLKI